jgi:hypothetical protein
MLIGGGINVIGALVVIFGVAPNNPNVAPAWLLAQFLSGIWAGVFGANSPFLNGMVAGLPAVALSLLFSDRVHWLFAVMAWFLVPASALVAAAIMRFMRKRAP